MFKFVLLACLSVALVSCSGHGLYGHGLVGHGVYGHAAPIVSHTVGHPLVLSAPVVKTVIPATYTSHVVAAPVVSHGLYGLHGGHYGGLYGGHGLIGHGLYGHGLGYGHGGLLIKK